MKKANQLLLLLALLLAGSTLFSSCTEDSEIVIPEVNFTYDGWLYVANGETLTINEWAIDPDQSSEGVTIERINYYFDGKKVGESTSAPFAMSYPIEDESIGEHELTVYIETAGEGYAEMEYTLHLTVHVLEQPFALGFTFVFDDPSMPTQVRNGQPLTGHVELAEASFAVSITKVEYYWDDHLVDATTLPPYAFAYTPQDEQTGTHTLAARISTTSALGNFTSTIRTTIRIVE